MHKKLYEVQEYTLFDGWVNNWMEDENPAYFESKEEAKEALNDFIQECKLDFEQGVMDDYPDLNDFRIVELKEEI